jgi:hypothetical protein
MSVASLQRSFGTIVPAAPGFTLQFFDNPTHHTVVAWAVEQVRPPSWQPRHPGALIVLPVALMFCGVPPAGDYTWVIHNGPLQQYEFPQSGAIINDWPEACAYAKRMRDDAARRAEG